MHIVDRAVVALFALWDRNLQRSAVARLTGHLPGSHLLLVDGVRRVLVTLRTVNILCFQCECFEFHLSGN